MSRHYSRLYVCNINKLNLYDKITMSEETSDRNNGDIYRLLLIVIVYNQKNYV